MSKSPYKSRVLGGIDWSIGFTKRSIQLQKEYPELQQNLKTLRMQVQDSNLTRHRLTELKTYILQDPPWDRNKWPIDSLRKAIHLRNIAWQKRFGLQPGDLEATDPHVFRTIRPTLVSDLEEMLCRLRAMIMGPKFLTAFDFKWRVKTETSLQGKMARKSNMGKPWTHWRLHDLMGVRAEWHNTIDFIEFVRRFEHSYSDLIVYKSDYIGRSSYNGINYTLNFGSDLVELQTLTKTLATGAQLHHNTTYQADKNFGTPITLREAKMIRRVVNGAYYISFIPLLPRITGG